MTHDEMIAVLTAHRDGKEIQQQYYNDGWRPFDGDWTFTKQWTYRVKPNPREWWDVICEKNPSVSRPGFDSLEAAKDYMGYFMRQFDFHPDNLYAVHVREVLEDE